MPHFLAKHDLQTVTMSMLTEAPNAPRTSSNLVVRIDVVTPGIEDWPHRHADFFSLYLVRRGRGQHIIDGVAYAVTRGDVYVMIPGSTHAYHECDQLESDAIYFAPSVFDSTAQDALATTPGFLPLLVTRHGVDSAERAAAGRWLHLAPDEYGRVSADIDELRCEWYANSPISPVLCGALLLRLLVRLSRYNLHTDEISPARRLDTGAAVESTVAAAIRMIEDSFAEPLRVSQVAASVFLSPDRFTEVFSRAVGRSPGSYIRHMRIERAKSLLSETDEAISDVGRMVGLADSSYFTRAFRAETGLTPSRYRSSRREPESH